MFFQVHCKGKPIDGNSYPSLPQAALALLTQKNLPQGTEVVKVDVEGRVIERYTVKECQQAAREFLNPKIGK